MSQLSKHDLQFIDNYLIKHDFIFVDIRYEILDHIATAIKAKMQGESLNFYDAFKSYMVVNRKEILKRKGTSLQSSIDTLVSFSKTLTKRHNIIAGFLIATFFILFSNKLNVNNLADIIFKTAMCVFVIANIVLMIYSFVIIKKRYYCFETLSSITSVLYFYNLFLYDFQNEKTLSIIVIASTIFLFYAFLFYVLDVIKKFKISYL